MKETGKETIKKELSPLSVISMTKQAKRVDLSKDSANIVGNFSVCPICDDPLVVRHSKFGEWIIYCRKCKKDYYSLSYK